jgi:4-amino-4-deoxy-L-arabinose transferase-like glycosyltransferase
MYKKVVIFALVISILTIIRLIGFEKEGVTYDEPVYVQAGRDYIKALSRLDFSQEAWSFNKEHPPVTKYVYGIAEVVHIGVQKISNWGDDVSDIYTFARLMSVLLGLGTLIYVFFLARFYLNFWLSVLAVIVVGLNPLFIAHTRLVGHESVSLFFVTGMWYWYLLYQKTKSRKHFVIMNLHAILAFSTRFNNFLVMFPIWIWETISWWKNLSQKPNWKAKIPWVLIWLPISLWIGLFIIFPYWWTNPIESIQSTFNHWGGDPKELFFGSVITTPWTYYIIYFMYQTPILILFLGLLQVLKIIINPSQYKAKNIFLIAIFLIWLLWSFSPIKQGGMRYILPLYIPFSILAVMSIQQIFSKSKKLLIGFIILIIIYLGIQIKSTYPFYLDYYNEITGGASQVSQKNVLPVGFWGQGTLDVISSLDEWVKPGESVGFYILLMPEHKLTSFLPEGVTGIYKINKEALFQADWILEQSFFTDNYDPIPDYYTLVNTFYGANNAPLFYLYKNNNQF